MLVGGGKAYRAYIPTPTVVRATHSPTVNCMMGEDGNAEALLSGWSAGCAVTVNIFCKSSKTCRKRQKEELLTLHVLEIFTSSFSQFQCGLFFLPL